MVETCIGQMSVGVAKAQVLSVSRIDVKMSISLVIMMFSVLFGTAGPGRASI